jgi:arylsulfatase A-like enzyme
MKFLLATITLGILQAAVAAKPNIILVLTDDQRADTIHALGNSQIITPNLDRLAARSLVFERAYNFGGNCAAVCIPARNMLVTGNTYFRFDEGAFDKGLRDTLPKTLKAAGYETWYREKSGISNLPYIRTQFDHFADIHQVNALATGYAARGIVDEAIQFISKDRDKSKPFFLYLGFPCPHDPRWAAKEFRDLYDPAKLALPANFRPVHALDIGDMTSRDESLEAWPRSEEAIRRQTHDYYSLITGMDRDIGRLLDALEHQSLTDNTIVVFTSDQGIALGSHGLMGKQNLYDDTQRVPLLISGPGIPKGRSQALAYLHDLFPTLSELVGAKAPEKIDGLSLVPIISGKVVKVRDSLVTAYANTQRSIRDDQWHLIRFPQINRQMLFDLRLDPNETNDLASDPRYSGEIGRLSIALKAEQQRLGDTLPLVAKKPKPAAFIAPKEKLPTPYPAGGLAPGIAPEPNRPKPAVKSEAR